VKTEQDPRLVEMVKDFKDQGMSYQKIAEQFNQSEIGTRSGEGKWFGKMVRVIIL